MSTIKQQSHKTACKDIFNVAHPEDVIISIRTAADALTWAENLFNVIANDPAASMKIKRLAEMGSYVSADISCVADCMYADMSSAIKRFSEAA